ncbi:MAG TPA: formylmethanofuran--tetrahydromethanopterin N-formyltransferase, partial [Pirellulales bacterium]
IVTAATRGWAETVGRIATGFATSVIGCDCEAAVDRLLEPDETPDGRPGVQLLFFAFSSDRLQKALVKRIGQCVLTCPTTACYDALPPGVFDAKPEKRIRVGGFLRYFGDGFQISKKLGDRRFWRIPAMDGEFLCEDTFGTVKGVGGGNFLVLSRDQESGLIACEKAAAAMRVLPDVILPFPGGCVRSGSKVGSRYSGLVASTNEAYCPTLRGIAKSALPPDVQCAYEVVIDGLSVAAIEEATRVGVKAACLPGVVQITAGNYGGKLGPFHFHLHKILQK